MAVRGSWLVVGLIALSGCGGSSTMTTPGGGDPTNGGPGNGATDPGANPPTTTPPTTPPPTTPPPTTPPPAAFGLDAAQKLRAMQIISVFENSTIVLQYDYVEALGDGRGYTCGLGFTTGTGDAYAVVKTYTDAVANNPLAQFVPRLKQLADAGSGSITGLNGFDAAWKQAAADAKFRDVQTARTDIDSYEPALAHAKALGLKTALGITILYDTVWMHGDGSDGDGVPALITRANAKASASDEAAWLKAFLAVTRDDLLNPADKTTQAEWSKAVGRVDALADILTAKNFDLKGPIQIGHGYDTLVP